jgi:hypothetical protein
MVCGRRGAQERRVATIIDIRRRSAVLADFETSAAIKIAGAMYNVRATGHVAKLRRDLSV